MSNYTSLYSVAENRYCESAPALIAKGALLKHSESGKVLIQLKLQNISKKTIKAEIDRVRCCDNACSCCNF